MVEEIRAMWYDTLEELLQCPVCLEVTQGVKHQCINGHHLCQLCKSQLMTCPICKSNFINTRNLVVEQISAKFNDIKISLLHPYHLLNRKVLHDKVCIATQTEEVCTSLTSSACQTEPMAPANAHATSKGEEQKAASMYAPKIGRGLYPCRIGPCTIELPHGRIIGHLRYYHKDVFREFDVQDNPFQEKWTMEYCFDRNYDFAFQVKGMGLFFLNVAINDVGDLKALVHIVNCIAVSKEFTCTVEMLNAKYTGQVKSCRVLRDQSNTNCLHVSEKSMRDIIDNKNFFHCDVTIKRRTDRRACNVPNSPVNIEIYEDALSY